MIDADADAVAGLQLHASHWASVVDSTADFLNSAQLSLFVRVTGNDGFITKSLLTKRLHAQFAIVRQCSHW